MTAAPLGSPNGIPPSARGSIRGARADEYGAMLPHAEPAASRAYAVTLATFLVLVVALVSALAAV